MIVVVTSVCKAHVTNAYIWKSVLKGKLNCQFSVSKDNKPAMTRVVLEHLSKQLNISQHIDLLFIHLCELYSSLLFIGLKFLVSVFFTLRWFISRLSDEPFVV